MHSKSLGICLAECLHVIVQHSETIGFLYTNQFPETIDFDTFVQSYISSLLALTRDPIKSKTTLLTGSPAPFAFLCQSEIVPSRVEGSDGVTIRVREEFPLVVDRMLLDETGHAEEQSRHQTGHDATLPGAVHSARGNGTDDVVPAVKEREDE